jgi:prepilin-type processing-associated H-X9-DG protein
MAFGEILRGVDADNDYRGVHWYDHVATSQVYTKYQPNTPNPDVILSMWCTANTNRPEANLPCVGGASNQKTDTAASRSRHPGGVDVALCDGSVRIVNESVGLTLWQAMGSISKGEITGEIP